MPRYIEELVSQQVRKSEMARAKTREGEPPICPTITISRRMGSGARVIAEKLAHDCGYSLWSKELIDAVAQDAHVSKRVVSAFDEKAISEIEVFTRSILGDYELGGFLYGKHLARAIASIAKLGNAIILGRGANFLLPNALNIRIDATDEHRISNMIKFEDMSRSAAEAKIRASDHERYEFLVRMFGRERVENASYDLTLCMDSFSIDDAVEIVKTAVSRWRKRLEAE